MICMYICKEGGEKTSLKKKRKERMTIGHCTIWVVRICTILMFPATVLTLGQEASRLIYPSSHTHDHMQERIKGIISTTFTRKRLREWGT